LGVGPTDGFSERLLGPDVLQLAPWSDAAIIGAGPTMEDLLWQILDKYQACRLETADDFKWNLY